MKTYAAVLRGINVSGHNIIKMADLKKMFEKLKFGDVRTYIQSGNVVFRSGEDSTDKLGALISGMILKTFGFNVPVAVLDSASLKKTVKENPFLKRGDCDEKFLHVTLLSGVPDKSASASLSEVMSGADEIVIKGRNAYLYCPGGYGNTKLSNTLIEKKLGVSATTRNWKTITVLSEMAGG